MRTARPVLCILCTSVLLSACANHLQTADWDPLMYHGPPADLNILVTLKKVNDKWCVDKTQTVDLSCPGSVGNDPKDTACQLPTRGHGNRRIKWKRDDSVNFGGDDPKFTLAFVDDRHPFNNTNGLCEISTQNTSFTCLVRRPNQSPKLEFMYKYDVYSGSEEDGCYLDPRVYLMR